MKLLILKQAKIEGETEPKVLPLGEFAFNVDEIVMIHSVIDKYDCVIKNVCGIRTKQGEGYYVLGEMKNIVELIESATWTV